MENKNQALDHRKILLEWEAPEFIPLHRGKKWYITAGIVLAALIAYALYSGSLTMAITFLLIAGIFLLIEKRKPRMIKVRLSDMGIEYDGRFYSFHQINAFWIVYHPPYVRVLYLRLSYGKRFKHLKIELNGESPVVIRNLLVQEIPEVEGAHELTIDLISRLLKLQ